MPMFDLSDSVPYLSTDNSRVVWTSGWDALLVASGRCIRVNARGVSVKPSHWSRADLPRLGWSSQPCFASPHALCDTGAGLCFPTPSQNMHPPGYNPAAAWGGLACSRDDDGRMLVMETVYDVSSCDALDTGGDLVFCNGSLAFARTDLPVWAYWSICLLAVYIVRALSYLVLRRVACLTPHQQKTDEDTAGGANKKNSEQQTRLIEDDYTVLASICCVGITLASGWQHVFVTREEAFASYATLVYVLAYAGTWTCARWLRFDVADPPIYNLISGTLLFVSMRLYAGVETPYNAPLIWAIAARVGTKMRARACIATLITSPLDALVLSLVCTLGFSFDPFFLIAIFTTAFVIGDMI